MDLLIPLAHLWPPFAADLNGTPDGVTVLFWTAMTAVFVVSVFFVARHFLSCSRRIKALRSLVDGQTKDALAQKRRSILKQARELGAPEVGALWQEFDESLVLSADSHHLYNTLDAEHFFNGRTLAGGLTASRLLAATPSFLVAMGVLGTFVGLTIGLVDLKASANEVEVLKSGIDKMIAGASVAFMTSVWGVLYSLLLNLLEKFAERHALSSITALQRQIDFLYPRIPAEQSLVHIADHTRESKAALQELHERIGDRLQETVQGMSEAMQQALSDTLNNIMRPAIDALVSNATNQSNAALDGLVGRFLDQMGSAGRQQGELMQQAANRVNAAVEGMSSQLGQLITSFGEQQSRQQLLGDEQAQRMDAHVKRLAEQSEHREQALQSRFDGLMTKLGQQIEGQMAASEQRDEQRNQHLAGLLATSSARQDAAFEAFAQGTKDNLSQLAEGVHAALAQSRQVAQQHEALMERLQAVSAAVAQSSQHMDNSASQLGLLSTHVRHAADTLGTRLEGLASQIQSAALRNEEVATQLGQHSKALDSLQSTLLEGAKRSEETAQLARDSFTEMQSHQR